MNPRSLFAVAVFAIGGSAALAGESTIPHTLNFKNVTDSRINQTVTENQNDNEKAVELGDFDNDGDLDVVIAIAHSDFGQRRNKLYRNDNGVFNEISGVPAIPGFSNTDTSRTVFLRDYDGDGWLDIYVINDSNSGPGPGSDHLYINRHPGGVFSEFVDETDLRMPFENVSNCSAPACTGAACSGVSIDADQDGDYDIYCGNYPNFDQDNMYFNQDKNPGFFTNVTSTNVPSDNDYTVDVASADMNGDGKLDLLISNHFDPNYIYYNNLNGAGAGVGDYRYAGSKQNLGQASTPENAMEPADFDNDGDQDIYWTNREGLGDRILQNTGNDANGKAVLPMLDAAVLPPSVTSRISRKVTVFDLNSDGRIDAFVMMENGSNSRPTILRNTTVNGEISFVDWTPGNTFPNAATFEGWHVVVFDADGNGEPEIFLGAFHDDHLFERAPSIELTEGELQGKNGGLLPALFNLDPLAVVGGGGKGEVDAYTASDIGSGSFISVVLNGANDYLLEVLDSGNTVIASSDRGGLGTEEALQVTTSAGSYTIQVTTQECAAIADLDDDCNVGVKDLLFLLGTWGPCPKKGDCPADFDEDGSVGVKDLLTLLGAWGTSEYVLEVLSRSGP